MSVLRIQCFLCAFLNIYITLSIIFIVFFFFFCSACFFVFTKRFNADLNLLSSAFLQPQIHSRSFTFAPTQTKLPDQHALPFHPVHHLALLRQSSLLPSTNYGQLSTPALASLCRTRLHLWHKGSLCESIERRSAFTVLGLNEKEERKDLLIDKRK